MARACYALWRRVFRAFRWFGRSEPPPGGPELAKSPEKQSSECMTGSSADEQVAQLLGCWRSTHEEDNVRMGSWPRIDDICCFLADGTFIYGSFADNRSATFDFGRGRFVGDPA